MSFINAMPATPELNKCDKHGEYQTRYIQLGERFMVNAMCPACAAENNAANEAAEQAEQKRQAAEYLRRQRLDAGVSLRNCAVKFEDYFPADKEQAANLKAVQDFTKNIANGGRGNVVMCGGVGTGKTMLACASVNTLLAKGKRCKIIKLIDLIRELKDTWRKGSETNEIKLIKFYSNIDLLVLDEVGLQFDSDTEKLFIFDVIDGRYQNMLPTMLISNLDITGVKQAIGERVVDRLREDGGTVLAFRGASQRKPFDSNGVMVS
ncbi:ATP-binding protein [Alishewanella sp. HL-SH06]|uniref:ATP-binding protein n=1 Tax=Alishewanella sp. HL-SH06 TaxID=3461144 RepID=UPI004042F7CB